MSDKGVPEPIPEIVALCEEYAEELFEEEEYYTGITKWQDGDFKVLVHRGKGHSDQPYRHDAEVIQYRHFDGLVVYSKITRYIDHKYLECHDQRELERIQEPKR